MTIGRPLQGAQGRVREHVDERHRIFERSLETKRAHVALATHLLFALLGCGEAPVSQLADAGSGDASAEGGPRLCDLGFSIRLRGSASGKPLIYTVSLQSCGTAPVRIDRVVLRRSLDPTSIDDFKFVLPGCTSLRCDLDIALCAADEPDCEIDGRSPGVSFQVPIRYENLDGSEQDGVYFDAWSTLPVTGVSTIIVVDP